MRYVFRQPYHHAAIKSIDLNLYLLAPNVEAALNTTLADVTSTANGAVVNTGTVDVTLEAVISAASGTIRNRGTLNETLDDVTVVASGTAGGVTGTVDVTLADTTSTASGTVRNRGTLDETLEDVTLSATGNVGIVEGTLDETLDDITSSASGTITNRGTLAVTLGDVTNTASGTVGSVGGGSPVIVDADSVASNGLETALGIGLSVSNNGGIGGLTVEVEVRDAASTDSYLDFNDMAFKTSGWTTKSTTLSDLTGGFYATTLDMTAITNLPANNLALEYRVSGSVSVVVMAVINRIDLVVMNSLQALTLGKFLALKD